MSTNLGIDSAFAFILLVIGLSILPLIFLDYFSRRLPVRRKRLRSLFSSHSIREAYFTARRRLPAKKQDETTEQYEQRVEAEFDKVFAQGFEEEWGICQYIPSVLMACLVTGMAMFYLIREAVEAPLLRNTPPAVFYALLGAIFWSIWSIIKGYTRTDITPTTLYRVMFRYILAVSYGLLASELFIATYAKLGAFVIATLPFNESLKFVYSKLTSLPKDLSPIQGHPKLTVIQGITQSTVDKLEELGVHTSQELAFSDPLELLFLSNFSPKILIDWMDQAFLLNYVGEEKMAALRPRGIRGAIEMATLHALAEQQQPDLSSLATTVGISETDFRKLIRSLWLDNQLRLIWAIWGEFE